MRRLRLPTKSINPFFTTTKLCHVNNQFQNVLTCRCFGGFQTLSSFGISPDLEGLEKIKLREFLLNSGLPSKNIELLISGGFDGKALYSIKHSLDNKRDAIEETCKTFPHINRDDIKTLVEWFEELINAPNWRPEKCGNYPYQADEQTISSMANTLLRNIKKHKTSIGDQELLVCSGDVGTGKTRLGVEFLSCWKKQISQNPKLRTELATKFGQESVEQLENSEMVYIDCRTNTMKDIEKYLPKLEKQLSFIIIDEIDQMNRNDVRKFIKKLQEIPTISLYVCGILDSLAPTISSIQLTPLTREGIKKMLQDSNNTDFEKMVTELTRNESFDGFVTELYEETKGVLSYLLEYLVNKHDIWINSKDFKQDMVKIRNNIDQKLLIWKNSKKEDFNDHMLDIRTLDSRLSTLFEALLKNDHSEKTLQELETLLMGEALNLELDSKYLETKFTDSKHGELNLGTILNGFLLPTGKGRFKLQLPKVVIESLKTILQNILTKSTYILNLQDLLTNISRFSTHLLEKGQLFERMSLESLIFRMEWGFKQGLSIGEVIPFLKNTDVESIPCFLLEHIELEEKLMDNDNNTIRWKEVLKKLKPNTVGTFKEKSHSPDKIWLISHGEEKFVVQFQEKNINDPKDFNKKKLQIEIEKNEKIRKVNGYQDAKIIMVFLIRSQNSCERMVYGYGQEIDGIAPGIKGKNTQVIIPSEEDIKVYFGKDNIQSLQIKNIETC